MMKHLDILRTSEVASAVNVHPNTVRLYEQWGYLPPIPRTASGYRQFSQMHLEQMRLARLAFTDPWPGRHLRRSLADIVRTAAGGSFDQALDGARQHQQLVASEIGQAQAAAAYLEEWVAGRIENEDQALGLLSGETAELLDVTKDTLRHWERSGLIEPPRDQQTGYRCYGPLEIGRLRVLRLLTRAGYSTMSVLRVVRSLDTGRLENLGQLLDNPSKDEDVLYMADRWLTTLDEHDRRSRLLISQVRRLKTLNDRR